jgi:TonB-linked SusC/RagA family outer membrane protein
MYMKKRISRPGLLLIVLLLALTLLPCLQRLAYATPTPLLSSPPITVSGKVVSASDNQPLPGVNVSIKGQNRGTITSVNGEFTLDVDDKDILVFSFIGYATVEIPVNGKTRIDVSLQEEAKELGEVTVISTGYQNVDKRLFTGSVVQLNAKDIKSEGTVDVGRMLQGRAAGVSVQNVSGTFGTAPKIRVRGATSITGNNKPLWVIDGVVLEDVLDVSTDQLTTGDASTLIASSVAGLNSDDIESFNILKDASATALYGARAKDGVIVITTKRGKVGAPIITYTGNFSTYLKPSYDNYNIMNSADQMSVYAEMERKELLNHGAVSQAASGGVFKKMYDLISTYDPETGEFGLKNTYEDRWNFLNRYARANTDWFDELFKNSFVQEHSLGISGGTPASQYYFSTSYYDDNGWSIADNVQRYTANARGNFKLSEKVSFGLLTTGSMRKQRAPGTISRRSNPVEGSFQRDFDINPFSYALNTSRVITPYDENGDLEYFTMNYAPFNIINETNNNYIDLNQLDLKLQGQLNVEIVKDLKYEFIGAVRLVKTSTEHSMTENSNVAGAYRAGANGPANVMNNNRFLYRDPDFPNLNPVTVLPEGGIYNRTDDQMNNYYLKNQLSYTHAFGSNQTLFAVLGQELRSIDRQSAFDRGFGYQFDKGGVPFTDYRAIKQLLEGNINYFGKTNKYERYASFFLSGNYSLFQKYIVNGTVRMDGSNRLGSTPSSRWLPTWNVSAAWNADMEPFMKKYDFVDFLTLKAGYGLTANAGNATNAAAVFTNSSTRRPYLNEIESQIQIENLENSDLTWEKQYEFNIQLNTGFLNRFNLTLDWYQRQQFDLISVIKTSGIGGESYKAINYADMVSGGIEFSLGVNVVRNKEWNWVSTLIFSQNQTEITSLDSEPRIFNLVVAEGGPVVGYPVRGLFSIDYRELNPLTGVPSFVNDEGEVSPDVDIQSLNTQYLKYEGPVDPTITGGFSNTAKYKNFTLNVFLTYQAGNKIRLNPVFKTNYSDLDAMPREFGDRWVIPGDEAITDVPSIADFYTQAQIVGTYPYNNYNYSTMRTADGGFVRLRTISLAYVLPPNLFGISALKNASITLTGTNLFLLYSDKKLYGQDPEFFTSGGVAMPVPKQITASLKLSL